MARLDWRVKSGYEGERKVKGVLKALPFFAYEVLNNSIVKFKNGTSMEFDHIVVTDRGVFVIETKNHSGVIRGDAMCKEWYQWTRGRGWQSFYSPYQQNLAHMRVLNEEFGVPYNCMCGLVVFTSSNVNLSGVSGLGVLHISMLQEVLLNSYRRGVSGVIDVKKLSKQIRGKCVRGEAARQQHKRYVSRRKMGWR